MNLPAKTEAGNAGTQPRRGIAWWAHRDDERQREDHLPALPQTFIGSKDPDAVKIPARRAEYSLTESAPSPFQAEPTQRSFRGPRADPDEPEFLQYYRTAGYDKMSEDIGIVAGWRRDDVRMYPRDFHRLVEDVALTSC